MSGAGPLRTTSEGAPKAHTRKKGVRGLGKKTLSSGRRWTRASPRPEWPRRLVQPHWRVRAREETERARASWCGRGGIRGAPPPFPRAIAAERSGVKVAQPRGRAKLTLRSFSLEAIADGAGEKRLAHDGTRQVDCGGLARESLLPGGGL